MHENLIELLTNIKDELKEHVLAVDTLELISDVLELIIDLKDPESAYNDAETKDISLIYLLRSLDVIEKSLEYFEVNSENKEVLHKFILDNVKKL